MYDTVKVFFQKKLCRRYYVLKDKYNKLRKRYVSIKEINKELQARNKKLEIKLNELERNQSSFVDSQNDIKRTQSNDSLIECTKEYQRLYEKMKKSPVLSKLMENFGIDIRRNYGENSDVIRFVAMIGNELSFSEILYKYLETCEVPLNEPEIEFCMALNSYYKQTFGLKFDIIICLNDTDKKFDKNIMKDINNRNTLYKYFSEIYAPIIMRSEDKIERLALVKGHN